MNKDKSNKLKDLLGLDSSMTHETQIEEMSENVKKLQSNVEFYKEMVRSADALRMTIEVLTQRDRGLSSNGLADIIAGTLLVLEEKGFIDILRKEEK